jgi:hypothetical protein
MSDGFLCRHYGHSAFNSTSRAFAGDHVVSIPVQIHSAIHDVAVIAGGVVMTSAAVRQLF